MDRIPERWWFAISGVLAVIVVIAGWQLFAGGDGSSDDVAATAAQRAPSSSPSVTSRSTTDPSADPTPDRDAWRSKFTKQSLREFDYALRTWERFGELMEPHYREPGDPDSVRRIFETYTYNPTGYTDSYIANYINGGVRVIESTIPLYVTGRKIEINKKGGLVEFDQCTDYSQVDMRRNGKSIPPGPKNDSAILRVQMGYQPSTAKADGGWRVLTSKVVDRPCE